MIRFPATDAKNRFGEVLEAAHRGPVEITKKGRSVAVLLSAEVYHQMMKQLGALAKPTDFSSLRSWRKEVAHESPGKPLDAEDYHRHLDQKYRE